MTNLITFACYGCHLHGEERGSVDCDHNLYGTPIVATNSARAAKEISRMAQLPYSMGELQRSVVLDAIQEVCRHRD